MDINKLQGIFATAYGARRAAGGTDAECDRAGIAAVAEWLEDHGKDDWFKARHIRAQLEQPK